ncbi:DNA helicase [Tanacetum coccineum]
MRLLKPGLNKEEQKCSRKFADWLLHVGNGELREPDQENAEDTYVINAQILTTIEGETTTYLSNDEAIPVGRDTGETEMLYLPEYLNTLKFLGFMPHELQLKVGSPIMLLRNINLSGGLCNDTRMIVKSLRLKLESLKLLQRQLFRSLEDWEVSSLEEGPWLELQFSLVDNSKLNVVYLLNRS